MSLTKTSRNWIFTSYILPVIYDNSKIEYCVYQKEKGNKKQKIHWQGYIELNTPIRYTGVKKIFDNNALHVEERRGTRDKARNYCMKPETRLENPMEFGTWHESTQGRRSDIDSIHDMVKAGDDAAKIADECFGTYLKYHRGIDKIISMKAKERIPNFRDVKIITYWGKPGTGKTRQAISHGNAYFLFSTKPLWFDGYTGEPVLIIDDYDGDIDYDKLLRILDGYKMQWPVKGGSIWAEWTTVVITSNKAPCNWYNRDYAALTRRTGFPDEFLGTPDTSDSKESICDLDLDEMVS